MNLIIANRQRTKKINLRLLKQIAQTLLVELKIENAELGINLISAKEMAALNWKFLRHEGATDVITFDHQNCELRIANCELKIHGELFVCVDEAIVQSDKFGTNWEAEIIRYIVHGVLHLLGHDDLKPDLRRKMKRKENRLVRHLEKRFALAQLSRAVKMAA